MVRTLCLAVALVAAGASGAIADPAVGSRTSFVPTPLEKFTPRAPASTISPFIYLNRCTGGCNVLGSSSVNDARQQTSTIPQGHANNQYAIGEFANSFNQKGANGTCIKPDGTADTSTCTADASCVTALGTGAYCDSADYEWNLLVTCMKEVYSPYQVTLQDTVPSGGVSYTESIIAGVPQDIGLTNGFLGIAPLAGDCSAQDNVISFSFANAHGGLGLDRVYNMCWTAAQETAHAFGLDHEFQFVGAYPSNANSACMDPMTYRTDCGGQKFFRDASAFCGENAKRDCHCGGTQNSHQKILGVFGPGTPITKPPTMMITVPTDMAMVGNGAAVQSSGGAQRGIEKLELSLNGYVWTSVAGAAFQTSGQPYGAQLPLIFPNNVPDSIIDIVVKAYDDLNIEGDSQMITVTKGAPCTADTMCSSVAKGQICSNGRCMWNPPTGQLGATCTYDQFCVTNQCVNTSNGGVCTQSCPLNTSGQVCPAGFDCTMGSDPTNGFCLKSSKGGCCSAGGDNDAVAHFALTCGVLGLVMRRRRRVRSAA
jgi:hypothetical protein